VVAMLRFLEAQQDVTQTPDRDLCFVADVRLGETIGPSEDHARHLRTSAPHVGKSCLLPNIEPRKSVLKKEVG
jgi:hypothetical protein